MERKEHEFEQRCVTYARERGLTAWKNEHNGNKGIPDHSFLTPTGRFFMVEFKKDKKATIRPEQRLWVSKYPDVCFICDNFEHFTKICDYAIRDWL